MIGIIIADLMKAGSGAFNKETRYTSVTIKTIAMADWLNRELKKSYVNRIQHWRKPQSVFTETNDIFISFIPIALYYGSLEQAFNKGQRLSQSLQIKHTEDLIASAFDLKWRQAHPGEQGKSPKRIPPIEEAVNIVKRASSFQGAIKGRSENLLIGALAGIYHPIPKELRDKALSLLPKEMIAVILEFEKQSAKRNTDKAISQLRFIQM